MLRQWVAIQCLTISKRQELSAKNETQRCLLYSAGLLYNDKTKSKTKNKYFYRSLYFLYMCLLLGTCVRNPSLLMRNERIHLFIVPAAQNLWLTASHLKILHCRVVQHISQWWWNSLHQHIIKLPLMGSSFPQ